MRGLDEVLVLQRWNSSLPLHLIHLLQLSYRIFLYLTFDDLNNIFIVRQVRSVTLQANHVQRGRRFKRPMYVIKFSGVLRFVQIGRHATIAI